MCAWDSASDIPSCLGALMMVTQRFFFVHPAYFNTNHKESSKLRNINVCSLCSVIYKRQLLFSFDFSPVTFFLVDASRSACFIHTTEPKKSWNSQAGRCVFAAVWEIPGSALRHYPRGGPDDVTPLPPQIVFFMAQLVNATNPAPPSLPRAPLWSFGCLWSWLVSSRWCFLPAAWQSVFHSWVCPAAPGPRDPETMAER